MGLFYLHGFVLFTWVEIDSSVSVTFISSDPLFPREIRASPRCTNLSNKGENKRNSKLKDES